MFIKISRLCMIITASIFIGLSIGFYIINAVSTEPNPSTTLPAICILCMVVLIAFIFTVQYTHNRAEKKKESAEKENLKITNNKEE